MGVPLYLGSYKKRNLRTRESDLQANTLCSEPNKASPPHNEEGFLMTRSESEWKAYHQALWSAQLCAKGVCLVFPGKGEGRRWCDRKWKRTEGGEKCL